jgi:hypothetical protein
MTTAGIQTSHRPMNNNQEPISNYIYFILSNYDQNHCRYSEEGTSGNIFCCWEFGHLLDGIFPKLPNRVDF